MTSFLEAEVKVKASQILKEELPLHFDGYICKLEGLATTFEI